ncbi:MAG: histidine kinase [Nitrospirae bacterium]|nr:MAG: histidine kinase [Nitrospirota bacterium]
MIHDRYAFWSVRYLVRLSIALMAFSCFGILSAGASDRIVKVGLYENAPKIFTAESGKPAGIFIEIIEHIAKIEGWDLRYVPGTFGEGLDRLLKGEIDLMPDVAYSADREAVYSFHKVPVLTSWFQVFAPTGNAIRSIADLNGKRILVLDRSVQHTAFIRLSTAFGVRSDVITMPDYKTMFEAVAKGEADAAVTNTYYGIRHAKKYGLEDTAVVFEPSELFFAAPENAPRQVLDRIDSHLSALKKDPQSVYYASLKRWTSEEVRFTVPAWMQIIGLMAGLALVMSLAGGVVLKHQVNARTLELQTSERRYRQLFASNPAPMFIYQRGTLQMLAVNNAFVSHYGYSAEEALSLHLPDLCPEEEKGTVVKLAAGLKGHECAGEWHHLKADGSIITIVARSENIDYWGSDARIAVIADITDRKRVEEALRHSEEKFFKAFHATPDAIVISRAFDGLLIEVNDVFLRKTGYSREDALSNSTVGLNVWADPHDREHYIAGIREQGNVRDLEAQFRTKTGAVLDGLVSGEPIVLGDNFCLLTIIRDITERKKAEEQIRRLNDDLRRHADVLEQRVAERTAELAVAMEKAQAADRIKSAFLATMSHELRTPLNSIIGFTGILLQGLAGTLNTEQHKQLTMVQSSARHLLALINDVLDISKIEAGELHLSPAPFDLRQSVEKMVKTVSPLAHKKGIALRLDIADAVGTITTDQRRLEQVMLNLLNNAVKFTEKGHVRISCRTENDHYLLSFSDTGVGMQPEDIPNIFQPFRQIDSGLTRKHEGTGLGLSICKKIIDIMDGTISVESQLGAGSTFTVRLPGQSGGQS